jgi:hypothetical protein
VLESSDRTGIFSPVVVEMVQVTRYLHHYLSLIYSILSYSMILTVSFIPAQPVVRILEPCPAQLLVLRDHVRTRRRGAQLVASIPLSQRILRGPRTSSREIGCTGTTPRRQ